MIPIHKQAIGISDSLYLLLEYYDFDGHIYSEQAIVISIDGEYTKIPIGKDAFDGDLLIQLAEVIEGGYTKAQQLLDEPSEDIEIESSVTSELDKIFNQYR